MLFSRLSSPFFHHQIRTPPPLRSLSLSLSVRAKMANGPGLFSDIGKRARGNQSLFDCFSFLLRFQFGVSFIFQGIGLRKLLIFFEQIFLLRTMFRIRNFQSQHTATLEWYHSRFCLDFISSIPFLVQLVFHYLCCSGKRDNRKKVLHYLRISIKAPVLHGILAFCS